MTNWTTILIIGAVILVAVFFVLPMLSGSGSGAGGSIGGGMPTTPSGDIGQGSELPKGDTYNINYVPPSTAGVNTLLAPQTESTFTGFYIPSVFGSSRPSSTVQGQTGYIPISPYSSIEEQRQFYGENLRPSQIAPQSYLDRVSGKTMQGEGSGKSTTHTLSGGTYTGQDYSKQGGGNYTGNLPTAKKSGTVHTYTSGKGWS